MNDVPLQRRICPLEVRTLQRLVSTSRMYLVRQVGPTSWDVADSNRGNPNHVNNTDNTSTVRVSLGTSHRCSCLVFNRTKELCRHIVWILTHKLKLKCSDQLSYQLGMSEAQLLRCLEGKQNEIARRNKVDGNSKSVRGKPVPKRPISARDSCPICLESFGNKSVMYCKYSCGNAMHTHCMDIVSKHQDTSGSSSGPENGISCPLCRGFFCTPYELTQELRKPTILVKPQPLAKFEMTCIQCDASTIIGVVYKCAACPQMVVCSNCLKSQAFSVHSTHGLLVKTNTKEKWKKTVYPESKSRSTLQLNKLILPKIKTNKEISKESVPNERNLIGSEDNPPCPICTDQSMNVVELECGHLVPSPEPTPLTEVPPQTQKSPRPVTGRAMRSPPQPLLPPPQVVVTRAELYARNKPLNQPKGIVNAQKLPISTTKATRRKPLNERRLSTEHPQINAEDISVRENGRLLGSKVLPIMELLLQRKAEECEESNETIHNLKDKNDPIKESERKVGKRKLLTVQCVQLLPDGESGPLPSANTSRRSWQR